MVQKWFTGFRCDRMSTETIPSLGCPNETTTPEMINKIHDILLNDPKAKVREIAEIISISTERVVNILHTRLCMRKLSATLVPRLLTIDQKCIRVTTSEKNLIYFNRNPKELLRRFVTMDETWIHHYTLESREGSKQYLFPNLKRWLCGTRFESNEEVVWETKGYFGGFDKPYYLEGIEKFKDCCSCCIYLKGEYIGR